MKIYGLSKHGQYVIALIVLILMGSGTVCLGWKFEWVTAWAAGVAAFLGVGSWVQKNDQLRKNDNRRLTDSRAEKLADLAADILETSYRVHDAIFEVTSPMVFGDEQHVAMKALGISEGEGNRDPGYVNMYRFNKCSKLWTEYKSLQIKAKVNFPEEIEQDMVRLSAVVGYVWATIQTSLGAGQQGDGSLWKSITILRGKVFPPDGSEGLKQLHEALHGTCGKLKEQLADYIHQYKEK